MKWDEGKAYHTVHGRRRIYITRKYVEEEEEEEEEEKRVVESSSSVVFYCLLIKNERERDKETMIDERINAEKRTYRNSSMRT